MIIWVIYNRPEDFPDHFVVRRQECEGGKTSYGMAHTFNTLADARAHVPPWLFLRCPLSRRCSVHCRNVDMKKLLVSYSNCQGSGICHFLKRTPLADEFEWTHWNNYQLILLEQDRAACFESLKAADVVLFQPTSDLHCIDGFTIPDSDTLFASLLRPNAIKISYCYQFNHGFFPIVRLGPGFDGWVTSEQVRQLVKHNHPWINFETDRPTFSLLHPQNVSFDCARRFCENLAEQSRREQSVDIRMTDFILANFQTRRLFLTQNHPSSVMFAELARRIISYLVEPFGLWGMVRPYEKDSPSIEERIAPIQWTDINESNLPGMLPVHPAVVRELNLKYPADTDCSVYRTWLEQMISEAAQ